MSSVSIIASPRSGSQKEKAATPGQDKLKEKIILLGQEISVLKKKNNAHLCTDEERHLLKGKEIELETCQKKLKKQQFNMERQSKFRENRKRNLQEIISENPELKNKLHIKEKVSIFIYTGKLH